jgi:hypothetical protein
MASEILLNLLILTSYVCAPSSVSHFTNGYLGDILMLSEGTHGVDNVFWLKDGKRDYNTA